MSAARAAEAAALVSPTPVTDAPLSTRYAADPDYWASATVRPSWAKIASPPAGAWCDECAQCQHETRGACGPRMQPRMRRSIPGRRDLSLKLCGRHGQGWKDRDALDRPTDPQVQVRAARGKGQR